MGLIIVAFNALLTHCHLVTDFLTDHMAEFTNKTKHDYKQQH